jgi:hypothetical protein
MRGNIRLGIASLHYQAKKHHESKGWCNKPVGIDPQNAEAYYRSPSAIRMIWRKPEYGENGSSQ